MADATRSPHEALDTGQLFRSLYRHMGEGVALHKLVLDGEGRPVNYRILDVNPQYEGFTGLAPEAVIGKLATEAYGTPTAPYLEEYAAVAMGAPPRRLETYFAPHDRHYEISVAPMGPGYFATIFMDVSERKRHERALRATTDELDRFFSLAIDLLCIASVDGRFLRVNAAWASILGWSVSELEGKSFLDLVHPEDLPSTHAAVAELSAGNVVVNFVNRFRARDGSYRLIEWRSAPAPNGRIYAAARDVTQRSETEAALRQSEDRLRRIFELIPDPLTLTNRDGIIVDCNEAFCRATGLLRDKTIGRPMTEVGLWASSDRRAAMMRALERDGEVHGWEIEAGPEGHRGRTILLSARMFELGGEPHVITTAQDITERRVLEQQMLHSQKLESLGVLAGGIAHDFNNLLTGMLGNADLALRDLAPSSPAHASLDAIVTAARRASELCRQLLAYSGRGRFLVQPVDLADLVQEMGHLLSVSISKKAVIKYDFAPNLPAVQADATQMRQVVMNLIVNASEAVAERSGVISVSTGMTRCDDAYLKGCYCADGIAPGEFVSLEIADNGHGMDRATLDRIFDPFFSTKFTGRGLGLAAVLGIVRGHRGAVRVDSEPGRGTTFKLLFPPSDDSPRTPAARPPDEPLWRGHGLALVVDDEETVRNAGRAMLERAGFTVITANDGRDGVARFAAEKDQIAFVVLDLTMPELDGEACFRALRELRPDVKVLLTSGYDEQDAVNMFAGTAPAGFVQKPFTAAELLAKVREMLERDA